MSNTSGTDFDALRRMSDDDIDYSDVPPLGDSFFNRAEVRIPAALAENFVQLDSDIVAWFKARGGHYHDLIKAALREHMATH